MHAFFPPSIGRLGMILALGLALWAVAGTGQTIAADDPCGCHFEPPGFSTGSQPFPRCPWYVSTDGMALQQYCRDWTPPPFGPESDRPYALSQQDLDQPFQSGVRILIGHTFDDSPYQVEASYFWPPPGTRRPR